MKLQPIESGHLRECTNLFVSVFSNPPWNETWKQEIALRRLKDCYNTPGSYGIVAVTEDKVCGFAIGYAEAWHEYQHFYLKEMCVQSTNQRSGIGTKVMGSPPNVRMEYLSQGSSDVNTNMPKLRVSAHRQKRSDSFR